MTWKHWLHGLLAAFIGGGSGAVTAGFSATLIDPEHFNLAHGLGHTLELMGTVFVVSGTLAAFAYLKKSPLWDWDGTTERRKGNGTAT